MPNSKEDKSMILALIELSLRFGPTAAISIINGLETKEPTVEDIRALMVDAPESYFED